MSISMMDFMDSGQNPALYLKPLPWMASCRMELVTEATLDAVIDECSKAKKCVIDVETTGLDTRVFQGRTVDTVVGICLAPAEDVGFYVPLFHREGVEHNILLSTWEAAFRRLLDSGAVFIFHNGMFDHELLEYHGGQPWAPNGAWDDHKSFEDTLVLAYLENPRRKTKRLKTLSKLELGLEMHELSDLFPEGWKGGYDFSLLDPSDPGCIRYGCSDGICTFRLEKKFRPLVVNPADGCTQRGIYAIEKGCMAATRWMRRNQLLIDHAKVKELIGVANQDLLVAMETVYAAVSAELDRDIRPGYFRWLQKNFDPAAGEPLTEWKDEAKALSGRDFPDPVGKITSKGQDWPMVYDLFSDKQLGAMFDEAGIPGLVKTEKSGQIKTSRDVLDGVIDRTGQDFPWMQKVSIFRQVCTSLSNYLVPLLHGTPPSGRVSINFNGFKVDTGRFSTPTRDENKPIIMGWPALNLQSIPATYNDPANPKPGSLVRLRECFIAPPGWKIVAIDFSGEELRIVTNLSMEPKWLASFFTCSECKTEFDRGEPDNWPPPPPPAKCPHCGGRVGDLHTVTADSIFPGKRESLDSHAWAFFRGIGKVVNFQCCYGGGGGTVSRATGQSSEEGWRIVRMFKEAYRGGLVPWWEDRKNFGRQNGFVMTPFGRKYPVPDINLPELIEPGSSKDKNGFFRSKAERNAINGPVQATGADIIKIAMFLVYRQLKAKGWLDSVKLNITMHDELVFEIRDDMLAEAIPFLQDLMVNNRMIRGKKWPVPFTSDIEIGQDWTVGWDYGKCMSKGKWPAELEGLFPEPEPEVEKADGGGPALPPSPPYGDDGVVTVGKAAVVVPVEAPVRAYPTQVKDGTFTFQMSAELTPGSAHAMADVIFRCKDTGTSVLVLKDRYGRLIADWEDYANDGEPVLVNDQKFFFWAQEAKL